MRKLIIVPVVFLLRPFAGMVRCVMHRVFHDTWVKMGHLKPEHDAGELTQMFLGEAFRRFKDERFRSYLGFHKLDQTEQDRIFNELVVTAMLLLKKGIDGLVPFIIPERKPHWQLVQEQILVEFYKFLRGLGIPNQFYEIWKKLVALRIKEFDACRLETEFWLRDEKILFCGIGPSTVQTRINTIAVSSLSHLTRGKAKEGEPVIKYHFEWVSNLDKKLFDYMGLKVQDLR